MTNLSKVSSEPPAARPARRPRRKKTRAASEVREAILNAGLRAFARDGYDGASLVGIAAEAGTRHPLVLYHFGSKDGLWREIIGRVFGHLNANYGSIHALTKDLDSLSALKLFVRAFVQFSARYPERMTLILNELRGSTDRLNWLINAHIQPLHRQFDRLVSRAVADGQIKPIPAAHMAHLLIGAGSTFFISRPLLQKVYGIDSLDEDVVAAHAEWVVESLFNGLQTAQLGPQVASGNSNGQPSDVTRKPRAKKKKTSTRGGKISVVGR